MQIITPSSLATHSVTSPAASPATSPAIGKVLSASKFSEVAEGDHCWQLLVHGIEAFAALDVLMATAQRTLELEMYIYKSDATGARVRAALMDAVNRGVRVRVLLDAFGCADLPTGYFDEFCKFGGELRFFNPSRILRMAFRNHRKLCVVDSSQAIVGGFNVGDEYAGDGVHKGWRDLGLRINGPIVNALLATFEKLYSAAPMTLHRHLHIAHRHEHEQHVRKQQLQQQQHPFKAPMLLTSGPTMAGASLRRMLYRDLNRAHDVTIVASYFAPTWRLRRALRKAVRRGHVRLLLAGVTDVPVMRIAAHHLYERLLRSGVEIYEYQPQVLHAKLVIIDNIVYVGSSNFDVRSLQLNFDFLVRIPSTQLAEQARNLVTDDLKHSTAFTLPEWHLNDSLWKRVVRWVAYWLVTQLDPLLARRRWRSIR